MRAKGRSLRPYAVVMLAMLAELFTAAHGARILSRGYRKIDSLAASLAFA